ncbi:hypothetical protein GTU79_18320 [Sodalis ligni]|uniref:hypothetical protein n=1 Tax=Sodalis ligni TaxID=2697027 RepID=UPI001BDF616A|nr:hypothetical protein [Sodalis ligni]QWA14139.1 hypothetical protein GTU79_18320 [Sodalis ligni]
MAILNQIKNDGEIFWKRHFETDEIFQVKFDFICGLGPNLYEIQVSISEEGKPYYAEQRMIHWIDEAAFLPSRVIPKPITSAA